ncbi:MAG TPA: hypothetical protein VN764_08795, partial [Polyangiaceae bacterium]|nr:hypothetical protein [Polyangiaceae bacterium]
MSFSRYHTLLALSASCLLIASCQKHEESCAHGSSCLTAAGGSLGVGLDENEAGSGPGGVAEEESTPLGDDVQCLPALCPRGYCVDDECVPCVFDDSSRGCKDSNTPICLEGNTCVSVESQ